MKKRIGLILLNVAAVSFGVMSYAHAAAYNVGDKGPAGGVIFYDKGSVSDGWQYLEAAPADVTGYAWGCVGVKTGAQGTAIGTGKSNTQTILAKCSASDSAAKACADYRAGGKSDWFLPSSEELKVFYTFSNFRGHKKPVYWSSVEADANNALTSHTKRMMGVMMPSMEKKDDRKNLIRPIRAFAPEAASAAIPNKPAPAPVPAGVQVYRVGDKGPAGGWVFYDKGSISDGWRYLEMSADDLSSGAEYGCMGVDTGAAGTAIGTGKSNTQAILAKCSQSGTAAKICADYRGGGKSDWFFPSKEEAYQMFKVKSVYAGKAFEYMTSTEADASSAIVIACSEFNSVSPALPKNAKRGKIRAIRAFTPGDTIAVTPAKPIVQPAPVPVKPAPAAPVVAQTYKVGSRGPAGGWICYDKGSYSDGWRYLEMSAEDISEDAEYGCMDIQTSATGIVVGTGKSNTQLILERCSQPGIAARLCVDYRGGGKSDWFLPSVREAGEMPKVYSVFAGKPFKYITSTETDLERFFVFIDPVYSPAARKNARRAKVRAMRSF